MSALAHRDAIDIARANGDADLLREWREQANAVQLWAMRTKNREAANLAGEAKVRCEAALGWIDAQAAPHGGPREQDSGSDNLPPLANLRANTRAVWRKFGELEDGALADLITRACDDENTGVTTANVVRLLNGAHVGNNSGDNEWYTPAEYIAAARAVMGAVDLDPASSATANEVVGATNFYTADDDGLAKSWEGCVWMNPPYARPLIDSFCAKLAESFAAGDVTQAVTLTNNATETGWFHALAEVASAMCFPRQRIKFWNPDKDSATPLQGQAIAYLGENVDAFRREFVRFGFTVTL